MSPPSRFALRRGNFSPEVRHREKLEGHHSCRCEPPSGGVAVEGSWGVTAHARVLHARILQGIGRI
jgi:hypothetical protein